MANSFDPLKRKNAAAWINSCLPFAGKIDTAKSDTTNIYIQYSSRLGIWVIFSSTTTVAISHILRGRLYGFRTVCHRGLHICERCEYIYIDMYTCFVGMYGFATPSTTTSRLYKFDSRNANHGQKVHTMKRNDCAQNHK